MSRLLSFLNQTLLIRLAALLCFAAVGLGAFGAHGLRPVLLEHGTFQTWETAVLYHFIHAIALLAMSGWQPLPKGPVACFLLGILLFSGSLYVLAVTGIKPLGAITPFGGVSFLAGWLWLALRPAKA